MRRLLMALALGASLARPAWAQTVTTQQDLSTTVCPTTGNGAGCVVLVLSGGQAGAAIQIQGTFVGTVAFEGSVDGTTYTPINMTASNATASDVPVTSATTTGIWIGGVGGLTTMRARFSAYSSGTASVNLRGSMSSASSSVSSSTSSVTQGTSPWVVGGALTRDNAAPGATQVDVMPCVSGSSALSLTTNRSQKIWCNLFGAQAMMLTNSSTGAAYDLAPEAPSATSAYAVRCGILTTASTNSTSCKGSEARFYGIYVINTTATVYYLRLYNTASAPTCSSATGFIESIPIPASTTGAGFILAMPYPTQYATGLGYCITASSTSTANDNAAAGIFGGVLYK